MSSVGQADHFSIKNIPFGVASSQAYPLPQCVTRHENTVIFLAALSKQLSNLGVSDGIFAQRSLNAFAGLGRATHQKVREALQVMIRKSTLPEICKVHVSDVQMYLPVSIGDFTDFSCSAHHNHKAGQALMGTSGKLPPGFQHMPLGYAGRCSSIVVSGTPIRRPRGQYFEYGAQGLQGKRTEVVYGPCKKFDYELEMAVLIGKPVPHEQYVNATDAAEHVFGYVLLNDWSARDFQQLEMIPVGPLSSKHAATTVSAWVIMPDALAPFTVPAKKKENPIAPHLHDPLGKLLSVNVQVSVAREEGDVYQLQGHSTTAVMEWTFEQLIAHQSSSGCGLRTGDLLGVGTISGPGDSEQGCLLEQFAACGTPRRGYLEDGEVVQMVGTCGPGVGFGECTGKLLPASDASRWPLLTQHPST